MMSTTSNPSSDLSEDDCEKNKTPPKKKTKIFRKEYSCQYSLEWEKSYSWLKQGETSMQARCTLCNCNFSVKNRGINQVKTHSNGRSHQEKWKAYSTNQMIKPFCKNNPSSLPLKQDDINTTAIEVATVYHNVRHNLSYNSLDCGIKLTKEMYKTQEFSRKLNLGRTKAECIVLNVLGPKALELVLSDLLKNAKFFGLQTDASNVKNRKYFPIAVQYFDPEVGIVNKLIDFKENPDESAVGMCRSIEETFKELNLTFDNVSCLSADNCNANFGKNWSLFTLMNEKEDINNSILKANCHAHIIHNTVKHAIENLDYDVENLVLKLYGHFSISAKRRENLKEMSQFVDIEFKELLHHVVTRWLSLNPCITRILKSWEAILSYFRSTKECPKKIKELLFIKDDEYENTTENDIAEINLLFCNHFLDIFEEAILTLENNKTTIVQIFDVFSNLLQKLENRASKRFFGNLVMQKIRKLDSSKANKLTENFIFVIEEAIKYLKKWCNLEESSNNWLFCVSKLTLTNTKPQYDDFLNIFNLIPQKNQIKLNLNLDKIFDEVSKLETIIDNCNDPNYIQLLDSTDKWVFILSKTKEIPNIEKLVSYIFSMPASTGYVERIFSIMNNKWTDVRNKCNVNLIKAELQISLNFSKDCKEFYKYILNEEALLRAAHSNQKYHFKKN